MASGLPVVAFNYAAAARFIQHSENGWHVPLGDRDAFLSASTQLAGDAPLRRRLGAAARLTADGIPWDRVIDGFEVDLREVTARPRHAPVGAVAELQP